MKLKYFKPTIVLLVICIVISGALALTYKFTYVPPLTDPEDIIAAMSGEYEKVLPGSTDYQLLYRTEGYDKLVRGEVVEAVSASNGYVITAHSSGQYDSDPIRVMVGIDNSGNVTAVNILKISETPGLGMKTKSEFWLSQFSGGNSFSLEEGQGTRIDGVTSATKSSRAVVGAVNLAMEEYRRIISEVN